MTRAWPWSPLAAPLLAVPLTALGCAKGADDAAEASAHPTGTVARPERPRSRSAATSSATAAAEAPIGSSEPVVLPPRAVPPELRDAATRADAAAILNTYGLPAHESLRPLCGYRDLDPGGTTWVVDLFTSPRALSELRASYARRLGQGGLTQDTWTLPPSGPPERELALKPAAALAAYPRCTAAPPSGFQTLVVARRAQ